MANKNYQFKKKGHLMLHLDSKKGSALVEMALSIMLLMLLVFGIFAFECNLLDYGNQKPLCA